MMERVVMTCKELGKERSIARNQQIFCMQQFSVLTTYGIMTLLSRARINFVSISSISPNCDAILLLLPVKCGETPRVISP